MKKSSYIVALVTLITGLMLTGCGQQSDTQSSTPTTTNSPASTNQ